MAAIGVSPVITITYLWWDPPWCRALTRIISTIANLVAAIVVLQVFPFEFSSDTLPWETIVHVLAIIGVLGAIIGIISESVKLLRALSVNDEDRQLVR